MADTKGIAKKPMTCEEGVLRLMQQPGVLEAVLKIVDHAAKQKSKKAPSKKARVADEDEDEQLQRALALSKTETTSTEIASTSAAATSAAPTEYEAAPVGYVEPTRIPSGRINLPTIEAMQVAGYQGSAGAMRGVWQWAKDHVNSGTYCVWPAPVAGVQEALRFDAWGWPSPTTSCDEWINMLTYWTAMREQMISGGSRAQRGAVDNALAGFSRNRR